MQHKATDSEHLWIYSMGKRFRVRHVSTSAEEANRFCEKTRDVGVIAKIGPFIFVANLYEGVSTNA